MNLLAAYEAQLTAGGLKSDESQRAVAARLERLATELESGGEPAAGGLFGWLWRPAAGAGPPGLYIHGDVGRGKTMLMDLFFRELKVAGKRRVHFHGFMQDVHARLHRARQASSDAIAAVASEIAGEASVLCLDEMQITDIADAMIVGRLFEALLAAGKVIVTTSNAAPEELYAEGLNRQLFLPFVALIRERLEVVRLEGSTDYRLGRVRGHETFIAPLGPEACSRLQEMWLRLTDTEHGGPLALEVLGRKLQVPEVAHGCARFSFAELCGAALGPADYLAIARAFRTVFVTGIPALTTAQKNEARRLVLLVDTLYDAGRRLVASSANAPEAIFADGAVRIDHARTVSRLKEMQSAQWWGKKIAET